MAVVQQLERGQESGCINSVSAGIRRSLLREGPVFLLRHSKPRPFDFLFKEILIHLGRFQGINLKPSPKVTVECEFPNG